MSSKTPGYLDLIGSKFRDTEVDQCFVIDAVEEMVESKIICFRYHNIDTGGGQGQEGESKKRRRISYEHTPCEELLSASWVEWIQIEI